MRSSPPDPYAILGVPPTATPAEIRRAYRRGIVVRHRNGVLDIAHELDALRWAYERTTADAKASAHSRPPPTRETARTMIERAHRELSEHSARASADAVEETAAAVRELAEDYDRRELADQKARERRRLLGRLVPIAFVVLIVLAWLLLPR